MDSKNDKVNDILSLARRLLFRYAPDTEIILGYCKFVLDESVKTIAFKIEPGIPTLNLNPKYIEKLLPHELAVLLYIEAVRLALGHVTSRLYSDRRLSLLASDMICMRMGMRTDIGNKNVIYGIINERVLRMEESIKDVYVKVYKKPYDYRNVSVEILYRLLQKKGPGNSDTDSDESGQNRLENEDSPLMQYVNDQTRANNWADDSCLTDDISTAASENGEHWGNEDINGVMKTFMNMGSKVDFKHLMRMVIHKNTPYRQVSTRMRLNRRFGLMFPGYKNEYKPRILLACDISSSIQLCYVNTIIDLIFKTGKNVDVDYCWWNTVCTNPIKFTKYDKNNGNLTVKCGGGTDCDCVFRMLDKCKTRYDAVVIVTDFEFDTRNVKVSHKYGQNKIIWISIKDNIDKPPFAKKIVKLRDVLV